ncbi:MAG: hypothetical protein ACK4V0_01925 [Aphanizomenon sp.]
MSYKSPPENEDSPRDLKDVAIASWADFLYLALYNDPDSYDNNANWKTMIDNKIDYQKFSIFTNFSECFDGEIAFLVENDYEEKLIWQDFESKQVKHRTIRG